MEKVIATTEADRILAEADKFLERFLAELAEAGEIVEF